MKLPAICYVWGTASHLLARFGHAALNPGRFFSSAPHLIRRRWTCFKQDPDEPQEQSCIYKRALRLQRPSSVRFQAALRNSVSLIGTIERPLQHCRTFDRFGVFTVLRVDTGKYGGFRVLLKFWDEIAQVSKEYLKPSDLIYVSGKLGLYFREREDGKKIRDYEVIVTDVNFIVQQKLEQSSHKSMISKPRASKEELDEKRRDRLHLWQVLFANPNEWWDSRTRKLNPNAPDFKHKDTGEALWIRENDPFWVAQQLQLLDSRPHANDHTYRARPILTPLAYNEKVGNLV